MARAEAASASTRSDSIKGLAQSIAKPAYRRLLIAEPALRRAVPALIIAFLLTIGVGAVVQVLDHRRQVIIEAINELDNMADFVAERLDRLAGAEKRRRNAARSARSGALDPHHRLRPAPPAEQFRRHHRRDLARRRPASAGGLLDVLGDAQPLTILGASAGVLEITLADGTRALRDRSRR